MLISALRLRTSIHLFDALLATVSAILTPVIVSEPILFHLSHCLHKCNVITYRYIQNQISTNLYSLASSRHSLRGTTKHWGDGRCCLKIPAHYVSCLTWHTLTKPGMISKS